MVFLYLTPTGVMLSDKTLREMQRQYPKLELLRQFRTIQDARVYCQKMRFSVILDEQPDWTGITPEGRERMREKKRGQMNPNAGGLSSEHRKNISLAKKRQYRTSQHPMLGRRQSSSSKLKTSWTMRQLPKRRWCVDPEGQEHFIAIQTLPPGWCWGRARSVNRTL